MPITRTTQPSADNPSAAINTTTMAPGPDMGGDLAAAITLLAQTLAAQNARPQVTKSAPAVLVTSPTSRVHHGYTMGTVFRHPTRQHHNHCV